MPEKVNDLTFDEVKARVKKAIQSLEENDRYLFEHNASEHTLMHRFAVWLEVEFLDWSVDCEYNLSPPDNRGEIHGQYATVVSRRRSQPEDESLSVHPDIVVHRREFNENLMVIEVRKSGLADEVEFDAFKLKAYKHDPYLGYKFALLIRFQKPGLENNGIIDRKLSRWID